MSTQYKMCIKHYDWLLKLGGWTIRWQGTATIREPWRLSIKTDLGALYGIAFMLFSPNGTRVLQFDRT